MQGSISIASLVATFLCPEAATLIKRISAGMLPELPQSTPGSQHINAAHAKQFCSVQMALLVRGVRCCS